MFRINLYPEYAANIREGKLRAFRRGLIAGLLGLEVLIVGSLYLSGSLIADRADALRRDLPGLEARMAAYHQPGPELDTARSLVKIRSSRIEWAPKLAALSELIDASLLLNRVSGQITVKRSPAKFEIGGQVRRGKNHLEMVTGFVKSLQDDERIAGSFPNIRLDTLKGDDGEFQIICGQSKKEGS